MGTRSTIGIEERDGKVCWVYCHWDGYPANNGAILAEHYSSDDLVRGLLKHGDMSLLGERADPEGPHSYTSPETGVTVYYGRDRAEPDTGATVSPHRDSAHCQEYAYLWVVAEQRWIVADHDQPYAPLLEHKKMPTVSPHVSRVIASGTDTTGLVNLDLCDDDVDSVVTLCGELASLGATKLADLTNDHDRLRALLDHLEECGIDPGPAKDYARRLVGP